MVLLRNIDPEGTATRKSRRLKRHIYRTKVVNISGMNLCMI